MYVYYITIVPNVLKYLLLNLNQAELHGIQDSVKCVDSVARDHTVESDSAMRDHRRENKISASL
jgi:hypothetical protein